MQKIQQHGCLYSEEYFDKQEFRDIEKFGTKYRYISIHFPFESPSIESKERFILQFFNQLQMLA